jgi:hypothetical protein
VSFSTWYGPRFARSLEVEELYWVLVVASELAASVVDDDDDELEAEDNAVPVELAFCDMKEEVAEGDEMFALVSIVETGGIITEESKDELESSVEAICEEDDDGE